MALQRLLWMAFCWQVDKHRDHLINYIIFLRITPFLPNWFINITSPIINVPLGVFFLGTFLGKAELCLKGSLVLFFLCFAFVLLHHWPLVFYFIGWQEWPRHPLWQLMQVRHYTNWPQLGRPCLGTHWLCWGCWLCFLSCLCSSRRNCSRNWSRTLNYSAPHLPGWSHIPSPWLRNSTCSCQSDCSACLCLIQSCSCHWGWNPWPVAHRALLHPKCTQWWFPLDFVCHKVETGPCLLLLFCFYT